MLKLPRALELLTFLILNVPENFHHEKWMMKSPKGRVHGTLVPKGHLPTSQQS